MSGTPSSTLARLRRVLDLPIEDWLGVAALLAAFVVMATQIFLRYVLNDSLIWSEEAARYLLIAIAFLGCATGIRKRCHIRIDIIDLVLPPVARRALGIAIDLLVLFYLGYVAGEWGVTTAELRGKRRHLGGVDDPAQEGDGSSVSWQALQEAGLRRNQLAGTRVLSGLDNDRRLLVGVEEHEDVTLSAGSRVSTKHGKLRPILVRGELREEPT